MAACFKKSGFASSKYFPALLGNICYAQKGKTTHSTVVCRGLCSVVSWLFIILCHDASQVYENASVADALQKVC